MSRRMLIASLVIACASSPGLSDELQVATKGKFELVQTSYGDLLSFDGSTLFFAVPVPRPMPNGPEAARQQFAPQPTITQTYKRAESEIEIRLQVNDPQDPVNGADFAQSVPQHTKDVELLQRQYQEAQAAHDRAQKSAEEQGKAERRDLRKCSSVGGDQVVERDSSRAGAEKPPVTGKVKCITNGILTLTVASGARKYRLDDLSRIVLGSCSLGLK